MKTLLVVAFVFAVVLALGGCAAPQVLIHPEQLQNEPDPPPGKAVLVVIRERMLKGAIGGWSVLLDGRELSKLSIGNYVVREIELGEHSLSNITHVSAPTFFTAKAGRVYYFSYDLSLIGGSSYDYLDKDQAVRLLKSYTRVRALF